MQASMIDNSIAVTNAAIHRDRAGSLPGIWQLLSSAWLRHQERQIASAVRRLDHEGVLAEFRRASGD